MSEIGRMDSLRIIIDRREQNPYSFTLPAERGTLPTGDYSIAGLESLDRYRPAARSEKLLPKSAVQSLMAFSVRYRLPVFFAENRAYAARLAENLLQKFHKENSES